MQMPPGLPGPLTAATAQPALGAGPSGPPAQLAAIDEELTQGIDFSDGVDSVAVSMEGCKPKRTPLQTHPMNVTAVKVTAPKRANRGPLPSLVTNTNHPFIHTSYNKRCV